MRTPIIAGNWKMNTDIEQAVALVREMLARLDNIQGAEKVVCPPFVSLNAVKALLAGSSIKVGAQNLYFEDKGAYTGEISPLMLAGLCEYVILGHSERRQYFGETDEIVNRKVKAALKAKIKPIVCVGESLAENEAGRTEEVVTRQVKGAFASVDFTRDFVVAYEPIWAIGTGRAATGHQANATIGLIRRTLSAIYGDPSAKTVRIQYGGSVTSVNIAEFISQPQIDGALVGGASLKAADFIGIVEQTAQAKQA